MKTLRLNSVLLFLLAISANNLLGQAIVKISDVKIVSPGEVLNIPAGTTIELGAGAVLQVEGSLVLNGTALNPIRVKNMDIANPGLGIVISGKEKNGVVELNYVEFENQIQPIRFDPFWHRKSVEINHIQIANCNSGEPLIYVATSLTDLREGKKIEFKMNGGLFFNNNAGLLLENVGSDGILYSFDNLTFSDNHLGSSDHTMGLMHFDFANVAKSTNIVVGNLIFIRNYAGNNPVGLSVSGLGSQLLNVNALFQSNLSEDILFDKHIDNRIPTIAVAKREGLTSTGLLNVITRINHDFGQVSMVALGNPNIVKILDSTGNKVDYTYSKKGDTMLFDYIQGYPAKGILENGQAVNIPKLTFTPSFSLELSKVDTAEYNKFLRQKAVGNNGQDESDKIRINIPLFKSKSEIIEKIRVWEIGMWGGGAIYGGGDIHHKTVKDFKTAPSFAKNTILIKDIPVFSTVEYSFGGYGQYNINTRFSVKASIYFSTVSIHNIWSPAILAAGINELTIDKNYNQITPGITYDNMFITRMQTLEIEGLWHMKPYQIEVGKKSRLVPSLGLSLGIFHFTPYRIAYKDRRKGETTADYTYRMYSEHMYSLRELGSEGQNFLPGMEQYSSIATNIGSSFSLSYLRKRFVIKGEIKFVYTSTDYLDDFGPGVWYGGDINKLRASHQIDEISQSDLNKITKFNSKIAPNAPRSINGLNDWYFQLHLGASYFLFK